MNINKYYPHENYKRQMRLGSNWTHGRFEGRVIYPNIGIIITKEEEIATGNGIL